MRLRTPLVARHCATRRNRLRRTIVDSEPAASGHYPDEVSCDAKHPARGKSPALPPAPTVRLLLQDVAEGIRVLQTRDGVLLTNEQILERARNIVTGLLGNYRIRSLEAREFRAPPAAQSDGPAGPAGTARGSTQQRPPRPRLTARVFHSAPWVVVGACARISRPRRKPAPRAIAQVNPRTGRTPIRRRRKTC